MEGVELGRPLEPAGRAHALCVRLERRCPGAVRHHPEEHNVLVNPAHPDARKIHVVKVRKFVYDPG
jgi:hypothetical protein